MNTGLGWIDFSTEHRDKVYSVVEMLSESSTVDELGIGPIRDAIADWLFPGVSTIQTRPKYFILIPQILLKYFNTYTKHSKPPSLKDFLRKEENNLIYQIAENYNFEEGNGIIGVSVAKKRGELARKPSSIYWNGLRTHGIIKTELSLNDFLKQYNLNNSHGLASDDDQEHSNEDGILILLPPNLSIPENINLNLTIEEAKFLRDQYVAPGKHKKEFNMLRYVLRNEEHMLVTQKSKSFSDFAINFLNRSSTPIEICKILITAVLFNFLIRGAHIRYNILLHSKSGNMDFSSLWEEWLNELREDSQALNNLNLDYLFRELAPRTPTSTQTFIRYLKEEFLKDSIEVEKIDLLVARQEKIKKGPRAKLGTKSNSEEFDQWVGISELDYRFTQAKTIIKDIYSAYA